VRPRFKPDKEGEPAYTGISQSAIREMALCAELRHPSIIPHVETFLQDKSIYMVFSYCEHDLLQLIHHHSQTLRAAMPASTVRSIAHQILQGCAYLHAQWVVHRDLKPANVMVSASGRVAIGDLGLARAFREPPAPLYAGDKVVVTIWYRAPELLLGGRHYTPAVDLWAVGCIVAELLALRPAFKGDEAKVDAKKTVPFQRNQVQKIADVLGFPAQRDWPLLPAYPEYPQLQGMLPGLRASQHQQQHQQQQQQPQSQRPTGLRAWFDGALAGGAYAAAGAGDGGASYELLRTEGFALLAALLTYDPERRLTAERALGHAYFAREPAPSADCFEGGGVAYPKRKISQEDNPASLPGTKRSGLPDDSVVRPGKRVREG